MLKEDKVYLDYNATTSIKVEVIEEMQNYMGMALNPSSMHSKGRFAKNVLEKSREKIANAVNATIQGLGALQVVFTSSGTEANNMVIKNIDVDHIFVSAVEHPSIINLINNKDNIISVDKKGIVNLAELESKLKILPIENSKLVSIMIVNNETGIMQPIKEIARIVHRYNGILHCDAIQAMGKIKVDFYDLDVDLMTICSHKIGGPQGIASLIFKKSIAIKPILVGGKQEFGFRAGTESIFLIAGFAKACELLEQNLSYTIELKKLQTYLETEIINYANNAVIIGGDSNRVCNVSNIIMLGMSSETQMINFDLEGVCVSNGSACSSGTVAKSYVLKAMGYDDYQANSAIRVSTGINTKIKDIEIFLKIWKNNYNRTQNKN